MKYLKRHDSLAAERIAMAWHRVGMTISILATISGIGIVITAGIGAAWHRWAEKQHLDRIRDMERKDE